MLANLGSLILASLSSLGTVGPLILKKASVSTHFLNGNLSSVS